MSHVSHTNDYYAQLTLKSWLVKNAEKEGILIFMGYNKLKKNK